MDTLTPSPQLYSRILKEIDRQQHLARLKRQAFWHGLFLLAIVIAAVITGRMFIDQLQSSEFLQLSRLLATDFRIVLSNSSEYILSLLESFPAISSALLSLILLAALYVGSQLVKDGAEFRRLSINELWTLQN